MEMVFRFELPQQGLLRISSLQFPPLNYKRIRSPAGRSFEAVPLVKGMSAIQTSPGCGITVEPLILRGIAVQEGAVVTCGHAAVGGRRRNNFKLLAALVNPGSQSNEVLDGEFFHRLLNFLDVAHVPSPNKDSTPLHGSTLRVFEPSPAITGESG